MEQSSIGRIGANIKATDAAALIFDVRTWLLANTQNIKWDAVVDHYNFQIVATIELNGREYVWQWRWLRLPEVTKHWHEPTWDRFMRGYLRENLQGLFRQVFYP